MTPEPRPQKVHTTGSAPRRPERPASRRPRPATPLARVWAWAVRNWSLTLAGIVAAGFVSHLALQPPDDPVARRFRNWPQNAVLHVHAVADVAAVLKQIPRLGPIPVETWPCDGGRQGSWDGETIFLCTGAFRAPRMLLEVAAHECVHAMFDRLVPTSRLSNVPKRTVEETTANVLGFRLAGQVLAQRGKDADAYLAARMAWLRNRSVAQGWRVDGGHLPELYPNEASAIKYDGFHLIVYRPPLAVTEEVARICSEEPDPWDVLRRVIARYDMVGQYGPLIDARWAPEPQPTPSPAAT